ncbi:MAG: prolipoprotein diacylglyceryl transferase, partial [Gammaproteobacteria bacterium]|nr:prolipoprotein diacylglyceryl transferase [Gammaproteobacteria bacterium]
MLTYPSINPIAFNLGPLHVHWYGLMYLFSLLAAYFLGMRRAREPWRGLSAQAVSDILFYAAVGLILGGRLGYMFFYDTVN